jgi:hypothetical protein
MRTLIAAAVLAGAVSLTTIAIAQVKPLDPDGQYDPTMTSTQQVMAQTDASLNPPADPAPQDARTMASDREVGEARRAYRASCERYESHGFCECVTAGLAQALHPSEVRIAARTIGERITAQGDATMSSQTDSTAGLESSAARIEQVEGHYADACAQFRG